MQGRRHVRGFRGGLIALLAVLSAGAAAPVAAREVQTAKTTQTPGATVSDGALMQSFTAARADMNAGRWASRRRVFDR